MSKLKAFNAEHARVLLDQGIAQTELAVDTQQRELLISYLGLMAKWNPVYNLTAIRETDKMVSHHLLDSLVVLPVLCTWLNMTTNPKILDVGTGGGLPGIVLAIMQPNWAVTLVDPVHKKTAFLNQVKAQLQLNNVTVVTGKVEYLPHNETFEAITSRAFASIEDFVSLSQAVLKPQGFFAAMKGVFPDDELLQLTERFAEQWSVESVALKVPQLDAQRHLIKLTRSV